MDEGRISQFGSPLELYKQEKGIFRAMCDHSALGLHELTVAREDRDGAV